MADDAQRDLDEALPALDAALTSLKLLNKGDITEVKAMANPPAGVKLVMEAVCILQDVKPKMVNGDKPGTKVADYWSVSGPLLANPQKFLDSLFEFDKDGISDAIIKRIKPYIDNPDFTPAAIAKVSKACTSICAWARAMDKYHHVSRVRAPFFFQKNHSLTFVLFIAVGGAQTRGTAASKRRLAAHAEPAGHCQRQTQERAGPHCRDGDKLCGHGGEKAAA